jgi:dipeptidase E
MTLTVTDEVLRELLAEDRVVYGGYSAGACVLTPSLHGIELVDDPHDIPAGYPDAVVWDASVCCRTPSCRTSGPTIRSRL